MNTKTEEVLRVFEGFRMPPTKIDEWDKGGRVALVSSLDSFVDKQKPVEFLMLGFPFKSSNIRDKTIGKLPDLAEEVTMKNFRRFGEAMKAVYPAGVHLNILSDGFVFNDLLEISDRDTEAYGEVVVDMARDTPVELFNLRHFYSGLDLPAARQKVVEQFGIDEVEMQRRILFDANVNHLYLGISHFMHEELANRHFDSGRAHKKAAKLLARAVMFRNEAYSHLAATQFSRAIRLTMHASTNNGKYGFQLIPSPKAWTSAWHCALLIERDGTLATVHRKEADIAGHRLVEQHGRPYFYEEVLAHG